ncbi:MAG TPA: hypothetical protein VG890_08985 [Puia sp.]|nr:hypothetical protein [Puia sp.]
MTTSSEPLASGTSVCHLSSVICHRLVAVFAIVLFCLAVSAQSFPDPPAAVITNGMVHAKLLLPDAEKGYYRGTRFDWSGVVSELEYKGHSFCGQWFAKYNPTTHDAILGPADAFDPLGYDSIRAGSRFIKIGVGLLETDKAAPYAPFKYYKVVNGGDWKVEKTENSVRFTQTLTGDSGYAYIYSKEVKLLKGKPVMLLEHSLKNTGSRTIETEVFNHNFFVLDKRAAGPGLFLKFPFLLHAEEARGLGQIADLRGDSLVMLRAPAGHESVYAIMHGYSDSKKDFHIILKNDSSGAAVQIDGDRPLSKLVCWGSATILCPEPYIHIKVNPGETFRWAIRYELQGE